MKPGEPERESGDQAVRALAALAQGTLDAVSAQMCVLDSDFRIVAVNRAWRDFADANGGLPGYGIGASYIAACESSLGPDSESARRMAEGIRQVQRREKEEFTQEYPCHSPMEYRWFLAHVTGFPGVSGNLVVTHELITEIKTAATRAATRSRTLGELAKGSALPGVLDVLVRGVEEELPDAHCCVHLLDERGTRLGVVASPSLPGAYTRALDGVAVSPELQAAGLAPSTSEGLVVPAIAEDERWLPYRDLAGRAGVAAFWSKPMVGRHDAILGTVVVYHRWPRAPASWELEAVAEAARLAALALERTTADAELWKSRERLSAAMAVARLADWEFDPVRRVFVVNDRFYSLLGASAEKETRYEVPVDAYLQESCHPEDRDKARSEMALALTATSLGTPREFEHRIRRRDNGSTRHLRWVSVARFNASRMAVTIHGAVLDVTESKQAEIKLEEARAGLAEAQALAHLGSWEFVPTEQSGSWSEEMFRIFGRDPAAGVPPFPEFLALVHPEDREQLGRDFEETIRAGRGLDRTFRIVRPDGSLRWVESRGRVFRDASGQPVRMLGTSLDVTERKRAQDEQEALEAQLQQAQKMEAVGILAAGVAHDFNNVLATILSNVEIALGHLDDPSRLRASLDEIGHAGRRGHNTAGRILTFSRPEGSRKRIADLGPVVEDAGRMVRDMLPARLAVEITIGAEMAKALIDPTQIEQVILNLATNAAQAMAHGEGRIVIRADTVDRDHALARAHPQLISLFRAGPATKLLRLAVTDTGPGVDPTTAHRLFEPFFTTKPPGEGSGLGLSVVDRIVRDHDGLIVVESPPDKGATFAVYLPTVDSGSAAVQEPPEPVSFAKDAPSFGPRVIYVDDEEPLMRAVCFALDMKGYRSSGFVRPQEALDYIRAHPSEVDILITDNNMPGLPGLQLAREALQIRPDLKVGVVSGFVNEAQRREAAAFGVAEMILKGTMAPLYAALERLARGGRAQVTPVQGTPRPTRGGPNSG